MALRCRIFGHEASPAPVWNDGRHFSTCRTCGIDLVRGRGMVWHPAPPGMRIVWKTREEMAAVPPATDESAAHRPDAEPDLFLLHDSDADTRRS